MKPQRQSIISSLVEIVLFWFCIDFLARGRTEHNTTTQANEARRLRDQAIEQVLIKEAAPTKRSGLQTVMFLLRFLALYLIIVTVIALVCYYIIVVI